MNSANMYGGGDGGVCVCVCVLAHGCARVRWHAFVRDVWLIMIIIKIIILYFIQIRHTDDFHSTGTRLVSIIIISSCFIMYTF